MRYRREGVELNIDEILKASRRLGPHHQKYFNKIEKFYDKLSQKIFDNYLLEIFHLNRLSPNPLKEMKKIVSFSSESEILDLLGCYYSLQLILINLKALDVLQLNLSTPKNKYDIYKEFLLTTGNDFRKLSGSYMAVLIDDIFLKNNRDLNFVICGVGTRVDQDDIDVGVIDDGSEKRNLLNKALSRLNSEMFKNASPLHFHLSEHIGYKSYCASIEEYHKILDKQISNYVVISEMLIAVPIFGKLNLFNRFKKEIIERYYYKGGQDNRYHEGFIRGLLGEVSDRTLKDIRDDIINPKEDGLRMIKALISIFKVIKNVERNTLLEVLALLKETEKVNIDNYIQLYRAFTFIETFRFLYQILIAQEDEIYLNDSVTSDYLQKVALHMGFEDKPYAPAYSQLLIQYQEYIKTAKIEIQNLINFISNHLSKVSVFSTYLKKPQSLPDNMNIVEYFNNQLRFFRASNFWEDLLHSLKTNESLLKRFIKDLLNINERKRSVIIESFIKCGINYPHNLVSLIVIIASYDEKLLQEQIIRQLIKSFISRITLSEIIIKNLSITFIKHPEIMNQFLNSLDKKLLFTLINTLKKPFFDPDTDKYRKKLFDICRLYYVSSHYFKRFITKISTLYPEFIVNFNRPEKLKIFAEGLLKNIDNFTTTEKKIEKLGEYYDFEFLRVGIDALNGASFEKINDEFTTFSDNYISMLFELTKQYVMEQKRREYITKDLAAILASGGHARMQAFDDDYDIIVLLRSDDREIKSFLNKVVIKMNKHIIKRSIIAHNRFADIFKSWVVSFSDLKKYFNKPSESCFIEQTQLLGARIITGSPIFKETYHKEILKPYIFNRKKEFIENIYKEIKACHEYYNSTNSEINIKEHPGGLRDFENTFFIIKAYHEITEPISEELFSNIDSIAPELKKYSLKLILNYKHLKHIRDLYHLMVADTDIIYKDDLEYIIEPLQKSYSIKKLNRTKLYNKIIKILQDNQNYITIIVDYYLSKIS